MWTIARSFSFHGEAFLLGKLFLLLQKCTPRSLLSFVVSFRGKGIMAKTELLSVVLANTSLLPLRDSQGSRSQTVLLGNNRSWQVGRHFSFLPRTPV